MIRIDNKYGITVDDLNFILCEKKKDEKGNSIIEELTYHSELKGALKSYAKRCTKKNKPEEFTELEKLVSKVSRSISKCKDICMEDVIAEYNTMKEEKAEKVKHLIEGRKKKSKK